MNRLVGGKKIKEKKFLWNFTHRDLSNIVNIWMNSTSRSIFVILYRNRKQIRYLCTLSKSTKQAFVIQKHNYYTSNNRTIHIKDIIEFTEISVFQRHSKTIGIHWQIMTIDFDCLLISNNIWSPIVDHGIFVIESSDYNCTFYTY